MLYGHFRIHKIAINYSKVADQTIWMNVAKTECFCIKHNILNYVSHLFAKNPFVVDTNCGSRQHEKKARKKAVNQRQVLLSLHKTPLAYAFWYIHNDERFYQVGQQIYNSFHLKMSLNRITFNKLNKIQSLIILNIKRMYFHDIQ